MTFKKKLFLLSLCFSATFIFAKNSTKSIDIVNKNLEETRTVCSKSNEKCKEYFDQLITSCLDAKDGNSCKRYYVSATLWHHLLTQNGADKETLSKLSMFAVTALKKSCEYKDKEGCILKAEHDEYIEKLENENN